MDIFNDSYAYHDDMSIASSALSASIQSDYSSLVVPRRTCAFFCPPVCGSSVDSRASYVESKRDMIRLLNSENERRHIENMLKAERRRSRGLIIALFAVALIFIMLFRDQMPTYWKHSSFVASSEKQVKENEEPKHIEDEPPENPDADTITSFSSSFMDLDTTSTTVGSSNSNIEGVTTPGQTPLNKIQVEEKAPLKDGKMDDVFKQKINKLIFFNRWNIPYREERETPVHWHIPLSGGFVVNEIFSHCYGLVQAIDNVGLLGVNITDQPFEVVKTDDGAKYINVDMGSSEGIERAKGLDILNTDVSFVIRTPFLFEVAELFHSGRYAKCFSILRHPIERAMDVFQHLKDIKRPVFVNMTLEEYVNSPHAEANWMVRLLSNSMEDHIISEGHLQMAKNVLGQKCIVGFTDDMENSIRRFAKYFQWDQSVSEINLRSCISNSLHGNSSDVSGSPFLWNSSVSKDPKYGEGSEVWEALEKKNSLDLELYKYAKAVFSSQNLYVT